jgi:threonylcarbamoyladenosine tRNA methylthiotransferase MtaB
LSSFYVKNLGCKVNRVESDSIARELLAAGALPGPAAGADVVIVNSCTVTAESDSKSRKAVRQAAAGSANPWVIVTGCGVNYDAGQFANLADKVIVLPDKSLAAAKALELLDLPSAPPVSSSSLLSSPRRGGRAAAGGPGLAPGSRNAGDPSLTGSRAVSLNTAPRARVGIKVQDGCDRRCSYCIIPKVRGGSQSVSIGEIQRELQRALESGVRELVLTGIDLGSYRFAGGGLSALLERLLCQGSGFDFRLRLSSIEPENISAELLGLIRDSDGRICAHLHVPLQSGSDRVLAAMGRGYRASEYLDVIDAVRDTLPDAAITTDVIVGFPGESQADFEDTVEVCTRAAFTRMHVFKYSMRLGTPAAELPNQLPPAVAAQRSRQLRELAALLQKNDALARLGKTERVLVETAGLGRSESYYPVVLPEDKVAPPSKTELAGKSALPAGNQQDGAPAGEQGGIKAGDLLPMTFTGYSDGKLVAK